MEVFIRGLPAQEKERKMTGFFQGILDNLGIEDWMFNKFSRKPFATLTFLRPSDGQSFLAKYRSMIPNLQYNGRFIFCNVSNQPVDKLVVQSLKDEREAREKQKALPEPNNHTESRREEISLRCTSISCGLWDFIATSTVFTSYFTMGCSATIKFTSRLAVFETSNLERLVMPYLSIQSVAWENLPAPTIVLTLREAPRISRISDITPDLHRFPGLNEEHSSISGGCLVYSFALADQGELSEQLPSLDSIRKFPPILHRQFLTKWRSHLFVRRISNFLQILSNSSLTFPVKFQVQRLVQNCYLPPQKVASIIPAIEVIFERSGERICANVLRSLFREIPYASPDVDPGLFSARSLCMEMAKFESNFKSSLEGPVATEQVAVIHKVVITPSGVYLEGPDSQSKQRVLRKYSAHQDYFLRLQFCDEDGSDIHHNRDISNTKIYERFKTILTDGVTIAGRHFSFLGHPHSSLRAHTCWAVAPFAHNGFQINDRDIIRELGDFTQFRCPARCAARIGQAFSDTRDALALVPGVVNETGLPDVERNGRVFSDGVGTISMSALQLVWEKSYRNEKKPTVLQIRYRGAKGMLSLDTRLQGTSVFLRPSMTKFMGSNSNDLEICTAAHKPIPLYLNEQLVKILEDLDVPASVFLELQSKEINRLRHITEHTFNAGQFLKSQSIGEKILLPSFFNRLDKMNLSFQDDDFLTNVVEAAVLTQLRLLKYKARIPIQDGFNLLGVMDETGILEEGEIFCIVDDEHGESEVLAAKDGGNVVVTRSPALHPGDVQLAKAVTVPIDSPLMSLRNCICFSQKGARDLPSMLSGGDLDGDIYSVFLDPKIRPRYTCQAADYPRQSPVELPRPVQKKDLIDFFVKFMETDQVGRISNMHKMMADQKELGVRDPDCIKLAAMASTAVDYSKTGREVNMNNMPRYSRVRPHFMAPGPDVEIIENKPSFDDQLPSERDADEEEGASTYRYYRSKKILGRLFDTVDEKRIFDGVKGTTRDASTHASDVNWDRSKSLLQILWHYIKVKTENIDYSIEGIRARGIRNEYEGSLLDLMYEYGPRPKTPLSEVEVFIGNILGKAGAVTSRQRELSMSMKERYEDILMVTVKRMTGKGSEDEGFVEDPGLKIKVGRLRVCLACLRLALDVKGKFVAADRKREVRLMSFGYVAAIMTLNEMRRVGL